MDEKILTISVAAYNVENYLEQNLQSIVDSGCISNLEVFVIDDGGTDGSLAIAKDYENKFPLSIHAVHKTNGGYGSTVNYSIAHATGRFFRLLDGDDWVDSEGLKHLVEYLAQCVQEPDVVVTPYHKYTGRQLTETVSFPEVSRYQPIRFRDLKPQTTISMWAMNYRTAILQSCGLVMPEHMFYTDQYFATVPLASCNTVVFTDIALYCYRLGRDGQSVSRESRIKHTDETLTICKELTRFAVGIRQTPNYEYLSHRIAGIDARGVKTILLHPVNRANKIKLVQFEREIRSISADVYRKETRMGKTGKLVAFLRATGYTAYWLIRLLPSGIPNWV